MTNTADNGMLLSMQMISDALEELLWPHTLGPEAELPRFRSCQIYCGQTVLNRDTVYLLTDEAPDFDRDRAAYITASDLPGTAPHIRGLKRSFPEVLNLVVGLFQRYHEFENRLNAIVTGGGSLVDLCRAGSDFFQNPMYIHDNLFSVIALSSRVEGMLKFEYNERTGKLYIPLWLIDEFKYDEAYQQTLTHRNASLWDNDQYPFTMRSLYVNLYNGDNYLGRILINELGTPLQPGQFQAAEYLAKYAVRLILRDELDGAGRGYWGVEDTFIELLCGNHVDERDLATTLSVLDWSPLDKFLCMKIRNQDNALPVRSDRAFISSLSRKIRGGVNFAYQGLLCVVLNQNQSGLDVNALRQILAPQVRDSCMYVGISGTVESIPDIHTGFQQADIALRYILQENSSQWIVPFQECALAYIRGCATRELPVPMLVDSALLTIRDHDRRFGTQYYETLRAYLYHERNIPQTAAALIIHRTTLTYRLEKLQELVPLRLDDIERRLYLLLSYYILDGQSS